MTTVAFVRQPAGSPTTVAGSSRPRAAVSPSAQQLLNSYWYRQRADGLERVRGALSVAR